MQNMASRNNPLIAFFLLLEIIPGLASSLAVEQAPAPLLSGHQWKSSPAASFYDVLTSNSLPIGIFPKAISEVTVDPSSGSFHLRLLPPSPCDAKFETRLRFEHEISGNINYGRIANLSGVAAEELFLWLPVKGIRVDIPSSGLIYFDVEVVSKQFSLSFFETPKDCNALEATEDVAENNDLPLLKNYRARIVENHSRNFARKDFMDPEQRAVS